MPKSSELKHKSGRELTEHLNEQKEALRKFRFELSGSRTHNIREGRAIRKGIARVMTEINTRKIDPKEQTALNRPVPK